MAAQEELGQPLLVVGSMSSRREGITPGRAEMRAAVRSGTRWPDSAARRQSGLASCRDRLLLAVTVMLEEHRGENLLHGHHVAACTDDM